LGRGARVGQHFLDWPEHQGQRRTELVADVAEKRGLGAIDLGQRLRALALLLIGAGAGRAPTRTDKNTGAAYWGGRNSLPRVASLLVGELETAGDNKVAIPKAAVIVVAGVLEGLELAWPAVDRNVFISMTKRSGIGNPDGSQKLIRRRD
jgi:hypothetical protein